MKNGETSAAVATKKTPAKMKLSRNTLLAYGAGGCGLVLMAIVAVWALRPAVVPSALGRDAMGLLFQKPMQEELVLTDDQIEKLNQLETKRQGYITDMKNYTRAEREVAMDELSAWTLKKVSGILDPQQLVRLKQVFMQQRGTGAWNDDDVAKQLQLTPTQKQEILDVRDQYRKASQELRTSNPNANPQDLQKKVAALRTTNQQQLLAVLSDEQQATWKDMIGEPFKGLPELRRGGGNRGGGGGAPGGGNRGGRRGGN